MEMEKESITEEREGEVEITDQNLTAAETSTSEAVPPQTEPQKEVPQEQKEAQDKAAATVKVQPGQSSAEKKATRKAGSKKKVKFKVGQNVVYPLQGVGRIAEKSYRNFKGEPLEYYTIYIAATDMTVMLPVQKVHELGLRPIVPKAEAEQALKSMSDKSEPLTSDWKIRYQNNLDLLKQGTVRDIATVVRSLYHRSKVKELPVLERKLYDNALKLLVDEISLAMDREKEEIEDLLHTRLENSNN